MKRIGIITHNFPLNLNDRQNAGIFVKDVSLELADKNIVSVYCPAEPGRVGKIGKVNVISFPWVGGKKLGDLSLFNPIDFVRFLSFFVNGISNLSDYIHKYKVDVNIVMWAFPSGVFAYIAKKIYGIPYVVWCLGSDIYIYGKKPILKTVIKIILENAEYVFADGIDLANKTQRLSLRECIFVPSASRAVYKRSRHMSGQKDITLTFVGRLEGVKGPDIFVKSLLAIKNNIEKFKINIVGGGSLEDDLKEKVKMAGIAKYVKFYGNINDFQKIGEIVGGSDWLVIPSRSDSIPLVFSEAMKCSTPIIASSLPDLDYLVKKYKVGYLFKPGNFRQLANIIVKLPKLKSQRTLFSINTKRAAGDFNVKKSSRIINSYLEKI